MQTYYTYLWLREDGTPCYVGKGSGERAYRKGSPPRDRVLIQPHPSEEDAFAAEIFLIAYYGRKDIETGVLINRTDGGENPPNQKGKPRSPETIKNMIDAQRRKFAEGWTFSPETRVKMAAAKKERPGNNKLGNLKNLKVFRKGNVPWNKGKTLSEKHRLALRKPKRPSKHPRPSGYKQSPELIAKRVAAFRIAIANRRTQQPNQKLA